jgi:hypothetical protein
VFHRTNEDVLVEVKKAGAANPDAYVRAALAAVDDYSKKSGKPARMYLVFHGGSEKTPEDLLDKVSRGVDYDKVKVLYLKESSIPFDGRTAFTLYDTYGFPFDLTQDLCREKGIPVDVSAYDTAMQEQKDRARKASNFGTAAALAYSGAKTEFHGYDTLVLPAKVVALYRECAQVQALKSGDSGTAVLDRTPFYAESGGQVGDRGELVGSAGTFEVADTQKIQADVYGHAGTLKRPARSRSATGSRRASTWRCARAPCATIRSRISCTRRCAKSSARTCSREAHSSMPTRRASTFPTTSR